ncbi:hypothetical protein HYH03_008496 [Edaphochlamys debaryana]|uniref:BTB domain-containing protein n=1 Tax=Edaphochlamys debaryana TaxID=47281 RepID=A0A835Y136_9CHLO|nr:hypothetical protein HYH03_008496 [Edaphochlamys debaryana]|eukprot:KAG2493364.1 hypothetical protein HYH03_008496 [Edaphochlamys debaryana]
MRRLDVRSGAVTTLEGAELPTRWWWSLTPGPSAAVMLRAASGRAVCTVRTEGSNGGRVELVAGDWEEEGAADGSGTAARFSAIRALLPVSGGRLLIADGPDLRCMDAGGAVTTLLRGCFPSNGVRQMALLPSGELGAVTESGDLVLISGGDFTPSAPRQPQPPAASTERLLSLLALPAEEVEGAGGSGGGIPAAALGTVTVECDGFAESGAAEVTLPDADPAAFAHLLSYMYGTAMGYPGFAPVVLEEPPELLRPTAALAGRLLMGGAVAALAERLAAAATPASVLSDLAWADAHGMTDLAERLRAFALAHRKQVKPGDLEQLAEAFPMQATQLLKALWLG